MQYGWIFPDAPIRERKISINQVPHLGIELEQKDYYLMYRGRWGKFKAPRIANFYFSVDVAGNFTISLRSYSNNQERAKVIVTKTQFQTFFNGNLLNTQNIANFPGSCFLLITVGFTYDQRYETNVRGYSDTQTFFNLSFSTPLSNTEQHSFVFSVNLNNASVYFHKAEIRR